MVKKSKKSLGQNFLIDHNISKKIVNYSEIQENDHVIEIGPGRGILTEYILKRNPKKLTLIEKDNKLSEFLSNRFKDKVNVLNQDILTVNENIFQKNCIVIGNLPYNISTKILTNLIELSKDVSFKSFIFMFQKEVATKILATVNSKNYGRLSIISNWKFRTKKIMDVSPQCFKPSPKILSTVISFNPKSKYFDVESKNIKKITKIFFNHRRKKIRKPFLELFQNYEKISKRLNIDLDLRPQNISIETYMMLIKEFEDLSKQ